MDWTGLYRTLRASGRPFVMVTVAEAAGSAPREAGARCFVTADGRLEGTIGGGTVEEEARLAAVEMLRRIRTEDASGSPAPRTMLKRYPLDERLGQCCGGSMTLLFEAVVPAPRAVLFGAGHVGQALARVLAGTRLQVQVVDAREKLADPRRFPPGVEVTAGDPLTLVEEIVFDPDRTWVVIATHSHCLDRQILRRVLRRPARYVGMVGSRAKWVKFRRELAEEGFAEEVLDRVRCPAGLPLGDKRPAEIAVSIAAEILSMLPVASKGLRAEREAAGPGAGPGGNETQPEGTTGPASEAGQGEEAPAGRGEP